MSGSKRELFSAIPVRVDEAIDREDLTPRRGWILKRLVYRCGKSGETTFTLVELREWLRGYDLGIEALRQDLVALERGGWVALERSRGHGKSTWNLKLVGAALEYKTNEGATADAPNAIETLASDAPSIPTPPESHPPTDTDTDLDLPYRPVGERSPVLELQARQAAARLFDEVRREHIDGGTRKVVLAYAAELDADDFDSVRHALIGGRGEIRNEAKWVNGALAKRARARAAGRADAA